MSTTLRSIGVIAALIAGLVLAGAGLWYCIAVPSTHVVEPTSGLPAGGYALALGIGAIVVGLLEAGGAVVGLRGRNWPLGLLIAWQPFQFVIGVSLFGEPALTLAIGLVAALLLATAVITALSLIMVLALGGRGSD